jgi:hypothetical protein
MEKSVFVAVNELPLEKRQAAEFLLGEKLEEDELLFVRSSKGRIISHAAQGAEREAAFDRMEAWMDEMDRRVSDVPESEITAIIEEALLHARSTPHR